MVFGCTDDTMKNYSPAANFDDDSCIPLFTDVLMKII